MLTILGLVLNNHGDDLWRSEKFVHSLIRVLSAAFSAATNRLGVLLGCVGTAFIVMSCQPQDRYHDPYMRKTREDFQRLRTPPERQQQKFPAGSAPWRPIKTTPDPQVPVAFSKLVTLSLTGTMPLRQAFVELSRQGGFNLSLASDCPGVRNICYRAQRQPLGHVVAHLCQLAGLRYTFEHNTLHVQRDTPYLQMHNIQFLLGSRTTHTATSVKTDIFAEGMNKGSSKSAMGDNGASISMDTRHTVDFWQEVERTVALTLNISMEDTQGLKDRGGTKDSTGGTPLEQEKPGYAINRYAGVLSVVGTQRQHQAIRQYLQHMQKLITAQILIEAKIVEIDLNQEYKSGVNWQAFVQTGGAAAQALNQVSRHLVGANNDTLWSAETQDGTYSLKVNGENLTAFAQFMEQFGTVRTLANPRQTVINNQAAILKVAHNEVFFELQIQDEPWYGGTLPDSGRIPLRQRAQSRIQTVPIGLILYVHPSLNCETGDIIVSLHPTISRIVGRKSDPAMMLYNRGQPHPVESQVPIVQVREMDSVIVARPEQVIVIGGLMEERSENVTTGLPGLADTSASGLFSQRQRGQKTTELVILLRLSVVPQGGNAPQVGLTPADTRLYQEYVSDPRELTLPAP